MRPRRHNFVVFELARRGLHVSDRAERARLGMGVTLVPEQQRLRQYCMRRVRRNCPLETILMLSVDNRTSLQPSCDRSVWRFPRRSATNPFSWSQYFFECVSHLICCISSPDGRCQSGCHSTWCHVWIEHGNSSGRKACRTPQNPSMSTKRGHFQGQRYEALSSWQHRIGIKTADIRIDRREMVRRFSRCAGSRRNRHHLTCSLGALIAQIARRGRGIRTMSTSARVTGLELMTGSSGNSAG